MAKFDPFLSLHCARVEGVGAWGSNFAIWQQCEGHRSNCNYTLKSQNSAQLANKVNPEYLFLRQIGGEPKSAYHRFDGSHHLLLMIIYFSTIN